jgi:hypothetical protein
MPDRRRSRSEYATGEVLAARFLRILAPLSDRELEALAVTDPRSPLSNETCSATKRRAAAGAAA